jgi:23S rRNA pseudouridine1911/1915/1917 synthase
MGRKNYNADWDAGFVAPMDAVVPASLGGLRFDQALARLFPQYSRNRLQVWLREGHIRVEGRAGGQPLAGADPVSGGERVVLAPPRPADIDAPRAQKMPLEIVHEDRELIVLDKPAGLVVHPGAGVPDRTLLNALLAHAPSLAAVPRAGIVHRLDKDTSGLLVVAKTVTAQASLVKQLADRSMRRVYLATRARARAWRSCTAASPRARPTACSSASATRRSSSAASTPAARTRSASTSSTSATRSSATRSTAAARATASPSRARRCTPRS